MMCVIHTLGSHAQPLKIYLLTIKKTLIHISACHYAVEGERYTLTSELVLSGVQREAEGCGLFTECSGSCSNTNL